MGKFFPDVKPGDLITAAFINQLVQMVEAHEDKLLSLGGGQNLGVTITQLIPPGPVEMGSELRVIGTNFGVPAQNTVAIDNVVISNLKLGSGDTILIFDVPVIQGVPQQGRTATLRVANARGTASYDFTIVQEAPDLPLGNAFVSLTQPPTDLVLTAGNSYNFGFDVRVLSNMQETYTVNPVVTPPAGGSGWQAVMIDQAGNAVQPPQLVIPAGSPPNGVTRPVRIRVTIPGAAAAGSIAELRVTVTSTRNNNFTGSGTTSITVNAAPPAPQAIEITRSSTANGAQVAADDAVTIPVPTQGQPLPRINYNAILPDAGTAYDASVSIQNNAQNQWTATLVAGWPVTPQTADSPANVGVRITAQANAAPATLVVRVQRQGDATVFGEITQALRFRP